MIQTGSNNQFVIIDDTIEQIDIPLRISTANECYDCSCEVASDSTSVHNFLQGLQGGNTDQRYHLTANQWNAVNGANAPSSSNLFATLADLAASGSYAFTSGLTNTSGVVTLGGAMTQNAVVYGAHLFQVGLGGNGQTVFRVDNNSAPGTITMASTASDGSSNAGSNFSPTSIVYNITSGTNTIGWAASPGSISMGYGVNTTSSALTFSASAMVVTDTINSKGLSYLADYHTANSSNDRWIPDKAYVDNKASSSVLVPYTGAIGNVDLNSNSLTGANATFNSNLFLPNISPGTGAVIVSDSGGVLATSQLVFSYSDKVLINPELGINGNASAVLYIGGTNKGVMFPRLTLSQRNAIVLNSEFDSQSTLIFQTDNTRGYYYYSGVSNGDRWLRLLDNGGSSSNVILGDGTYAPYSGGGEGSGTVTSVSGVSTNGFTWSIANASTTPAITLTLQNATTSQSGQLTSSDWNTFNGKQAALVSGTNIKTINSTTLLGSGNIALQVPITLTTTGTSGAATFSAGTLNIPQYTSGGFSNPMTTAGDLILGGTSGTPGRLAIGSNNQVLTVVSGAVVWANASSGFANPMTTAGDLIVGGSGGTAGRLAIGASGTYLRSTGTASAWAVISSADLPNFFPDPTYFSGGGTSTSDYFTLVGAGLVTLLTPTFAKLASPTFTGTPSLPTGTTGITQTTGDNSTKLATTAFVQASLTASTIYFSTIFGGSGTSGSPITILNLYSTSATPGIAGGTGAGTSPTITIAGTNNDGVITVVTGTSPATSATVFTVTNSASFAYPTACVAIIKPANAVTSALSGAATAYVSAQTSTTWTISVGSTALAASTTYKWTYHTGGY